MKFRLKYMIIATIFIVTVVSLLLLQFTNDKSNLSDWQIKYAEKINSEINAEMDAFELSNLLADAFMFTTTNNKYILITQDEMSSILESANIEEIEREINEMTPSHFVYEFDYDYERIVLWYALKYKTQVLYTAVHTDWHYLLFEGEDIEQARYFNTYRTILVDQNFMSTLIIVDYGSIEVAKQIQNSLKPDSDIVLDKNSRQTLEYMYSNKKTSMFGFLLRDSKTEMEYLFYRLLESKLDFTKIQ